VLRFRDLHKLNFFNKREVGWLIALLLLSLSIYLSFFGFIVPIFNFGNVYNPQIPVQISIVDEVIVVLIALISAGLLRSYFIENLKKKSFSLLFILTILTLCFASFYFFMYFLNYDLLGFRRVKNVIFFVGFTYLFISIFKELQRELIYKIHVAFFASILISLVHFFFSGKNPSYVRFAGSFNNPNALGLSCCLLLTYFSYHFYRKGLLRHYTVCVVLLISAVFSGSLSIIITLFALFFFSLFTATFCLKKTSTVRRVLLLYVTGAVLAFCGLNSLPYLKSEMHQKVIGVSLGVIDKLQALSESSFLMLPSASLGKLKNDLAGNYKLVLTTSFSERFKSYEDLVTEKHVIKSDSIFDQDIYYKPFDGSFVNFFYNYGHLFTFIFIILIAVLIFRKTKLRCPKFIFFNLATLIIFSLNFMFQFQIEASITNFLYAINFSLAYLDEKFLDSTINHIS
jgi:hypothetical protein